MKLLFFLLALFLVASLAKYQDLRSVFLQKSEHHKKLSQYYLEQSKKLGATARQYANQAASYVRSGKSHKLKAKQYYASSEVHRKKSEGLYKDWKNAEKDAKVHLDSKNRYSRLASHYDSLAKVARARAQQHYNRYVYYLNLYKKYNQSYKKEIGLRDADFKKETSEKRLYTQYKLRAKQSKKLSHDYELKSRKSYQKERREKRLYRRYNRLHRRAVLLFEARKHKAKYEQHRKLYHQYLSDQKYHLEKYHKYKKIQTDETIYEKEDVEHIKRFENFIVELKKAYGEKDKEANLKIQKYKTLIQENEKSAQKHRNNAKEANLNKQREEQLARNYEKDAANERAKAKSEKVEFKRYYSQYKATFRRKTVRK